MNHQGWHISRQCCRRLQNCSIFSVVHFNPLDRKYFLQIPSHSHLEQYTSPIEFHFVSNNFFLPTTCTSLATFQLLHLFKTKQKIVFQYYLSFKSSLSKPHSQLTETEILLSKIKQQEITVFLPILWSTRRHSKTASNYPPQRSQMLAVDDFPICT